MRASGQAGEKGHMHIRARADIKQGVFHLLLKFREVPLDKSAPLPPAGTDAGGAIDAATGSVLFVTDENLALAVAQVEWKMLRVMERVPKEERGVHSEQLMHKLVRRPPQAVCAVLLSLSPLRSAWTRRACGCGLRKTATATARCVCGARDCFAGPASSPLLRATQQQDDDDGDAAATAVRDEVKGLSSQIMQFVGRRRRKMGCGTRARPRTPLFHTRAHGHARREAADATAGTTLVGPPRVDPVAAAEADRAIAGEVQEALRSGTLKAVPAAHNAPARAGGASKAELDARARAMAATVASPQSVSLGVSDRPSTGAGRRPSLILQL